MSRNFDLASGPNYSVNSVGSCGAVGNGAYTIIALFNINSGNNNHGLISFRAAGINAELFIDGNQIFGAGDFNGGQTGVTVSTWWWAAIRKAAGTSVYRYSLRQYNTGSTTHQDSAATHADSGVTNTSIRLGDSDDRSNGLVAVWAAWTSNLSDGQVAGMFTTAAADVAAQSPAGLWLGNQASSSDPINDSAGTANQTSVNGTVGVGSDPPSYNYTLSGSTGIWLPTNPARRRTPPPRRRPAVATSPRAQSNPPVPAITARPSRRPRGVPVRRGHVAMPVPAQVAVAAPAFVPRAVRVRPRVLRLFRGRASAPTPAQVVVVPPAYPPVGVRPRVRGLRLFRGRSATPVPAQVVVVPPAYPVQSVRARLRFARLSRGRAAAPVPSQAVVLTPAYVPAAPRIRVKWLRLFRGRAAAPVAVQPYPLPATHPRPRGLAPRRGHAAMPMPAQVAPAPPPYPPIFVRAKRRLARLFRPRAAMPVPAGGAAPVVPPSSPNPELFTTSSGRDLGTTSYSQDLITQTRDRDLEA